MTKDERRWSPSLGRLAPALPVALALACASASPPEPPQAKQFRSAVSAPQRLAPPEDLSGTARHILRSRMASHADDMGALVGAVMVLDYRSVEERARHISADVSLARPLTGDATELNSALPDRFFDLQDQLKVHAGNLRSAAAKNDALGVASSYGKLSETCVSCHASYRQGRP
jgi:cytochrome c556